MSRRKSPPQTTAERIRLCLKFNDDKYYLEYQSYFNVAGMVHSVVITAEGVSVLRITRGHTPFGPEKYAAKREKNIFRVTPEMFERYLVAPDVHVGKMVDTYGKEHLLEIVIYDEHEDSLKDLKSGDYVAVQNVHHWTRRGSPDTLVIHGGDGGHNRGISKIRDYLDTPDFLRMEESVHEALARVKDYEGFVEFVEKVADPIEVNAAAPEAVEPSKRVSDIKAYKESQQSTQSASSQPSIGQAENPTTSGKRVHSDGGPLPPGVERQDDEFDYMSGDLDSWPEGPPANMEETIYRMRHRKRRRFDLENQQ